MSPKILYEDNHLIIAEKRSGQTVQPEPDKPDSLEDEVKDYIRHKFNKSGAVFLGVIHRLDMPVSGIVIFAKTSKSLTRMNALFQKRDVTKIYTAQVHNTPPRTHDTLTHWLKRDEKRNTTKAYVTETKGAQEARLIYTIERKTRTGCILKIELLTGRKHQIRAQLSAMGCPIVGDVKYGSTEKHPRIFLHASEVSFTHPVTQALITVHSKPDFL